jgi:hypothetical protein
MKLALLLAIECIPAVAFACPACGGDGTPQLGLLLGAMIAIPYAVAALAVYAIRGARR